MAAFYTDIFIADPQDAEALGTSDGPESSWPHLWLEHLGQMELMNLWQILHGRAFPSDLSLLNDMRYQVSEDGPFVIVWPDDFVCVLANVQEKNLKDVATNWGQSEEMSHWEPSEVIEALKKLIQFAKRSKREGKSILQVATLD